MKTQTHVVVIGGGVVGTSVLYHLTKAGWTDVVLLERAELTHGSTWHSAGGMHTLNGDPNVAKLQQYTIELYKEIEEISGQDCGIHITVNSLRLDKSFGTWAREFRPIYGPFEAGLGRFVKLDKDFIGRDGAAAEKEAGPERRLLAFAVDSVDADVIGDEPIWHDGEVIGWVTSGGFAHHSSTSVALGYVPADLEGSGGTFEIEVLGVRRSATQLPRPLFDPTGERMRS